MGERVRVRGKRVRASEDSFSPPDGGCPLTRRAPRATLSPGVERVPSVGIAAIAWLAVGMKGGLEVKAME